MDPKRYLELLKRSVLNEIYLENELRLLYIFSQLALKQPVDGAVVRNIGQRLPQLLEHARRARQEGRIWWRLTVQRPDGSTQPLDLRNVCEFSHSMIGRRRLDNIEHCLDVIRGEAIPGDLVETGVWRGGACIFMRGYLEAYAMPERQVWVCDSFEGLPVPSRPEDAGYDFSKDKVPVLAVSLEEVQENFRRYDLLDERVRFVKGWFKDTLPALPVQHIALLRLDGDLYESTMDALQALYDKVVPGGFIIVDDYGDFAPCRRAIEEFRSKRGITDPIEPIDWTGVFWRKSPGVSAYTTSPLRSARSSLHSGNLQTIQTSSHRYAWKGVPLWKNPFDFALYWLLVWQAKPRTILEIGSKYGGSALWLADMLQLYGIDGRVVSVDINPVRSFTHPRIDFFAGDVANLGATLTPEYLAQLPRPWMVIEDSSHLYEHTLAALRFFHPLLRPGEFLIVEDGIVDDLGLSETFHGGPNRAVREFMAEHGSDYALLTELCDFWGPNVTWNTNGYWRKLGDG